MSTQTIWFDKPAGRRVFTQTLPFGNGRLGAVAYGDPFEERLQLNEESLWYGGPMDRVNPDSLKILPKVRKLILEGSIREAERIGEDFDVVLFAGSLYLIGAVRRLLRDG